MIKICKNCGIQVEEYSHGTSGPKEIRHIVTRAMLCSVFDPKFTKDTVAETLTVATQQEAIEYRQLIVNGFKPIPAPKTPLPSSYPYTKVTIIFEEDAKKTTYTIPMARNVSIENKAIPVSLDRLPRTYLTDSGELAINMTFDFDPEKGHLYLIEESRFGVPVED